MAKILFICTGNTCRSPMAEGLFNRIAEERGLDSKAKSAGMFVIPGSRVSDNAISAMEDRGIDIKSHIPAAIDAESVRDADLILTMTSGQKAALGAAAPELADKLYTLKEYANEAGEISDPIGGDLETYKKCLTEIENAVEKVIERLCNQ